MKGLALGLALSCGAQLAASEEWPIAKVERDRRLVNKISRSSAFFDLVDTLDMEEDIWGTLSFSSFPPTPVPTPAIPSTEYPTKPLSRPPTASPPTKPPTVPSTNPPSSPPIGTIQTARPTHAPTIPPTPLPTISPGEVLCMRFSYSVTNEKNLSSEDLFKMVNNTLKKGLEVATRSVTIRILNETFPRTTTRSLRTTGHESDSDGKHNSNRRRLTSIDEATEHLIKVHGFLSSDPHRSFVSFPLHRYLRVNGSRRLVYYTDEMPVVIESIRDNNIGCPKVTEMTRCSIVSSNMCVVLEGEDGGAVRSELVSGLRESIESGEFESAIPPI